MTAPTPAEKIKEALEEVLTIVEGKAEPAKVHTPDGIDAVLALIAERLPGWRPGMGQMSYGWWGAVSVVEIGRVHEADAPTPALALLAATLEAIKEMDHADR
jgi:hypothetical protein